MVYALSPHAGDYAFILAVEQHLREYRTKLQNKISEGNVPEETMMQLRETALIVQDIIVSPLDTTKQAVIKADIKSSNSLANSFIYNFDKILLKPKLSSFELTNSTTTKVLLPDILDTKKYRAGGRFNIHRESDLALVFGNMLKRALSIYQDTLSSVTPAGEIDEGNRIDKISDFDRLSLYVALFIKRILSLPENSGWSHQFVDKMNMFVATIIDDYSTKDLSLNKLRGVFIQLVSSSLEFVGVEGDNDRIINIINKLREQGNNLMSNQSYAQAIKIYTNAIDIATFPDGTNTSQLLTNRAVAFIGLNCFPEAIADLNEAVKLDRTFTPAWTQLGYCHLYMGKSLVALKCYLAALKSVSGEIIPEGYFNEEKDIIEEYRDMKIRTILPQFVQRLSQSIALTERRAYQQREDEHEIDSVIKEVKSILSYLQDRSSFIYDASYFDYKSTYSNSTFRSMAERANRSRPNILTQDVAQNMLASNGMEAEVSIPRNPLESFGFTNATVSNNTTLGNSNPNTGARFNDTSANSDNNNDRSTTTATPAANGVRELLNDFGDLFEGRFDIQEGAFGRQRGQEQEGDRTNDNPIRDVFRGILPRQLGNIIGRSFNNVTGNQNSDSRNTTGVNSTARFSAPSNTTRTSSTNSNTNNGNNEDNESEDIDMPQVPDLD